MELDKADIDRLSASIESLERRVESHTRRIEDMLSLHRSLTYDLLPMVFVFGNVMLAIIIIAVAAKR